MSGAPLAGLPVLVLAGGLGTRLRAVVADRPKGLAAVGDRSFLEIQISLLRDQGARHFVLCVGHRAEQVREAFGDGCALGVRIDYSVETDQLLGTAGALKLAERFFVPRALVVNGDTFLDADYNAIVAAHLDGAAKLGILATLTVCRLADASRFGTVLLDPTERFVVGFREKDPTNGGAGWLNAGAYVIERPLLDRVPAGAACSLEREWFPGAIAAGVPVGAVPRGEPFYDIGTPEDYRRFAELYEGGALGRAARTTT
jgi:NDP-sugar pyrophosphorylase family protein